MGATKTEELAVMLDTYAPLMLTKDALDIEDPDYWKSWQNRVTAPPGTAHTTGD
jgi:homogentisate 1,2-dioxygenase